MKILRIKREKLTPAQLRSVVAIVRRGGVVVYPTDTSYGIGCDATNAHIVQKIFQIKHRPPEKQASVIIGSLSIAKRYGIFTPQAQALAQACWPGALTIIVRRKRGKGTIGLRISKHPIAQQIVAALGRPVVSTSANISGKEPCYSIRSLQAQFKNLSKGPYPDMIIDAGRLPRRLPSTVIDARSSPAILLRVGALKQSQLNRLCPTSINKKP